MMLRPTLGFALALALVAGCRSTSLGELSTLAQSPPLTYSVLVSGGAFLPVVQEPKPESPLDRTWPIAGPDTEAFPLSVVVDALAAGRVFVRAVRDESPAATRAGIATMQDVAPISDPQLQSFLRDARAQGHDYVLVLERIKEGPVEQQGVNDQWPITAAAWLLLGLGVFVPDHSYEAHASLRVTLREVQTGQTVYDAPLTGGVVDLALWERASLFGLLTSIVIPPFWVADDPGSVSVSVREHFTRRLIVSLARQMKSFELQERLRERSAARIEIVRDGAQLKVQIDTAENLGVVRLRVDLLGVPEPEAGEFERRMLASERPQPSGWRYVASLRPPAGQHLQVIVQTVAGRVASVTIPLEARP